MSIKKTLSLVLCLCMVAGMFGSVTIASAAPAAYSEDFDGLTPGDLVSGTALDEFEAVSINSNMLTGTASTSSLKVVQDSANATNKYLEWTSELATTNSNVQPGMGLRFNFPKSVDLSKAAVTVAFKVNYSSGTKFRGIHYGADGEACTGFTHDSCHRAGMSYHENANAAGNWYDVELTYEKKSSTEANCTYKFKSVNGTTWTTRTGDLTTGSVSNGNSPKLGTTDNVDFVELTIYNNTGATTNPVVLIDDLTFSQGKLVATESTSYFEDFTNVNTATGLDSLALNSFGLIDFNEIIERNNSTGTATRSIDVVEASGNKYLKWTSNITNTNTQNNGVGIRFHFLDMINLQSAPVTAGFKLYVESFNASGWRALHFGDSNETACAEFTHAACGCHRTGLAYGESTLFGTGKWYDVKITYDMTKTAATGAILTQYKESSASAWTTYSNTNINIKTANEAIDCMELTIYRNSAGGGNTVIYLDDISFTQTIVGNSVDFAKDYTTASSISEITVGTKKNAEAANDTYTVDTTGNTTTAALDSTNGLKWTVKQTEAGNKGVYTWLDVDVEDFNVTNKPIEIQFTVKLFDDYRRPYNFPALVGTDGVAHKMGLGSATPSTTVNHVLEQALFRGTYALGVNYGKADSMRVIVGDQNKESIKYHDAMGAYYTFKYVIDPVTDTCRYYRKAAEATVFSEPYVGMPSYPVALETMPNVLDSIRFCVAGTSADCSTEGHMWFKDVSVKTLDAIDTVTGRITGRTYANVDTENVSDSYGTTADATVTYQVAYTDTSLAPTATKSGTVIAVAYNSQGTGDTERTEVASVREVKLLGTATLTNGVPQVFSTTFTGVPVRYDGSAVTKDSCIYSLYIWDSMTGLTPLSVGDMWISNDNGTK